MGSNDMILDCGLISHDPEIVKRFKELCEDFTYSHQAWDSLESFMEVEPKCRMVAFYLDNSAKENIAQQATELAQGITFICPDAYRLAIFDRLLSKEDTAFLKKSGINYILSNQELAETSKLEFVTTNMVRAEYVAIKEMDLVAQTKIPFDLYHLMPLSQKFLRIIRAGGSFDDKKQAKMKEVGEFYVHRSGLHAFTEYSEEHSSGDDGLMRQCRAQFLEFQSKYGEMAMVLSDQSESLSYAEGKQLLDGCNVLARTLAKTLSKIGIAGMWDVINNSSIGEFGSMERSPVVAAYTAFFAMALGQTEIDQLIFASLIMDLGVIFLSPSLTKKMRERDLKGLDKESLAAYYRYPQKSLDTVLSRRLPLDDNLKKLVLLSKEKADGTGFPKGYTGEKLTLESQILSFSSFFDQQTVLRLGQERKDPKVVFSEIIQSEMQNGTTFTPSFMIQLNQAFKSRLEEGQKTA